MAVGSTGYPDPWGSTIKGDIRGTMEIWELPWNDEGPVLYTFAEKFLITTKSGDIKGFEMGIWYSGRHVHRERLGDRSDRTLEGSGRVDVLLHGHDGLREVNKRRPRSRTDGSRSCLHWGSTGGG